jgi:hypothetical protein
MVYFPLPAGETTIRVGFPTSSDREMTARVFDEDMDEVASVVMDAPYGRRVATVSGLDGGTDYILAIEDDSSSSVDINQPDGDSPTIGGLSLHFPQSGDCNLHPASLPTSPYRVPVATAGTGTARVPNPTFVDEGEFGDGMPLTSRLVNLATATENAVEEFLTGSPAGGNATRALIDDGDVDPAATGYHDHSCTTFPDEGQPTVPLFLQTFGGIATDGQSASFLSRWEPPGYTDASLASHALCETICQMPDAPDGGDSTFEVLLLATANSSGTGGAEDVDAEVICENQAASATGATATGTFVQCGSTRFYRCKVSAIEFYGDERNTVTTKVNPVALTKTDGTGWSMLSVCGSIKGA